MSLTVIDHPLVKNKVSMLRDKNTGGKEFREILNEVAMLVCYEATRDAKIVKKELETPLGMATVPVLKNPKYAVIPILRAGIGMTESMLALLPTARVGHIGIYRDPETLKPVEYYCKLPSDIHDREILVVDPMIATGGSAIHAIDYLKKCGVTNIKMLCIITCPEGVTAITEKHPDVQIFTAAYDERLDENGYIVPGLGDAGDRLFGTK